MAEIRYRVSKPAVRRPELGTPPAYLSEADPIPNKFISLQKQTIHAIKAEKNFSKSLIEQYLGDLSEGIEDYAISNSMASEETPFDEIVLASIKNMQGIKSQILEAVDAIAVYLPEFEFECFIDFFSKCAAYFSVRKQEVSYSKVDFDNFKFFFQDLFVSMIGVLLKRARYDVVSLLITGPYFPKNMFQGSDKMSNCIFLNQYVGVLDEYRNARLKLNRISVTADTLKENQSKVLKFEEYILSEIVLYNATLLNRKGEGFGRDWWYPRTTVYFDHQIDLSFFKKLVIKRHFEKVKCIFNAGSIADLIEKSDTSINYMKSEAINFGLYNSPPHISTLVDMKQLGAK